MSDLIHEGQVVQTVSADWQTQSRGTNSNEYDIYVSCMQGSGEYIKTYDEWLNS